MAKELNEVELQDILPISIKDDEEVKNVSTTLDPFFHDISDLADDLPILARIDELPEEWLDLLAWQWHADQYDLDLSLEEKRALVKRLLIIHRYKGTLYAVKVALEPFEYEVDIDEYTGEHHTFDISVEPVADGADLGAVVNRAVDYINSAKACSRHIRNFNLHLTAPETNVYAGIAPGIEETVKISPTIFTMPETGIAYAGAGIFYEYEVTVG